MTEAGDDGMSTGEAGSDGGCTSRAAGFGLRTMVAPSRRLQRGTGAECTWTGGVGGGSGCSRPKVATMGADARRTSRCTVCAEVVYGEGWSWVNEADVFRIDVMTDAGP